MHAYAQRQGQAQTQTQDEMLFNSALRKTADRSMQRPARDETGGTETSVNASSRFAHSFARTPVHTASEDSSALHMMHMQSSRGGQATAPTATANPPAAAPPAAAVPAGSATTTTEVPATTVTFPRILSTTTPLKMRAEGKDRIPPGVDTPVQVNVNNLPPGGSVLLFVQGWGSGLGSATVNGGDSVVLSSNGSTTVQLQGKKQTDVGQTGKLALAAGYGGSLFTSPGFQVSAIPQDVVFEFEEPAHGNLRGIIVRHDWKSDSGLKTDLDGAKISEQIQTVIRTGCFAGIIPDTSTYQPATSSITDSHATHISVLRSPGENVHHQTHTFNDLRTGAFDIPMRKSGFKIYHSAAALADGSPGLTTTKKGETTTANGYFSEAGYGQEVTLKQRV